MKAYGSRKNQRGQIAELRFWVEALRRGIVVSRPHSGARYDFIVDCGTRLWRVQVKSTIQKWHRGYQITTVPSGGPYSRREVDFIAAYLTPIREWYIIPLRALNGVATVCLGPKSRLAKYREAWHLLLDRSKDTRIHIEARAEEPIDITALEEILGIE